MNNSKRSIAPDWLECYDQVVSSSAKTVKRSGHGQRRRHDYSPESNSERYCEPIESKTQHPNDDSYDNFTTIELGENAPNNHKAVSDSDPETGGELSLQDTTPARSDMVMDQALAVAIPDDDSVTYSAAKPAFCSNNRFLIAIALVMAVLVGALILTSYNFKGGETPTMNSPISTRAPTERPTPSVSPTMSPPSSPTERPTVAPTRPNTKPPVKPSVSPTKSPPIPTRSPTQPPILALRGPTLKSTMKPLVSPTMSPPIPTRAPAQPSILAP